MAIDERLLCECNSDLDGNSKISQSDVILLKALDLYTKSNSQKSFNDYFADLVTAGDVPNINLSSLNSSIYDSKKQCFDFTMNSSTIDDSDIEIFDSFSSYMDSVNKDTINVNDTNAFKLFMDSLKAQGIISSVDTDINIMIPTTSSEGVIYFTNQSSVPKVCEDNVGYDDTNTQLGIQVDSSEDLFLVADPGVKTYYDWDGTSSPRSWKSTGLCRILKRQSNELSNEIAIIHPPVDVIKNKTLPASDLIPMGTPAAFNGKTIAIDGNYVAVSWHYSTKGVVYIYKNDGAGNYDNIHEVSIMGDFSNGLPVIELKNEILFVSNPQETAEPHIRVFNLSGKTDYEINQVSETIMPSGATIKSVGFGSCLKANDSGTMLFAGHPAHYALMDWQIDQYTLGSAELQLGAVFVFKKHTNWQYSETLYPEVSDYETRSVASEMDLQFGYSIDYRNQNLFVSAPRAFAVTSQRREGEVYNYLYNSSVSNFRISGLNTTENQNAIVYGNISQLMYDSGGWTYYNNIQLSFGKLRGILVDNVSLGNYIYNLPGTLSLSYPAPPGVGIWNECKKKLDEILQLTFYADESATTGTSVNIEYVYRHKDGEFSNQTLLLLEGSGVSSNLLDVNLYGKHEVSCASTDVDQSSLTTRLLVDFEDQANYNDGEDKILASVGEDLYCANPSGIYVNAEGANTATTIETTIPNLGSLLRSKMTFQFKPTSINLGSIDRFLWGMGEYQISIDLDYRSDFGFGFYIGFSGDASYISANTTDYATDSFYKLSSKFVPVDQNGDTSLSYFQSVWTKDEFHEIVFDYHLGKYCRCWVDGVEWKQRNYGPNENKLSDYPYTLMCVDENTFDINDVITDVTLGRSPVERTHEVQRCWGIFKKMHIEDYGEATNDISLSESSQGEFTLNGKIEYSDSAFDTTSLLSGTWNFGKSIISNSTATKLYVMHEIPSRGSFVSVYEKSGGNFQLLSSNFYFNITSEIIAGSLAISSDDTTIVLGSRKILKILI